MLIQMYTHIKVKFNLKNRIVNNQSLQLHQHMTFKQQYLHQNSPFFVDFNRERLEIFSKIQNIILSVHPNQWVTRGIQPLLLIENFKSVYGFTSQQLTHIINLFLQFYQISNLTCQAGIEVLKTLYGLKEYRIQTLPSLKFDNRYFLNKLKGFTEKGTPFPLKNLDSYLQNLIKVIKNYSVHGQQHYQQILQFSIEQRDIKYIALFIKSVKKEETAQKILDYIFEESNIFERDTSFFFIIAQLTLEFPNLNIAPFYSTLFQQIIKTVTTIIDPSSDDELKRIVSDDPYIGVYPIVKSIAKILVNCIKPMQSEDWIKVWSSISRIFSIISGLIDHSHEVQSINDFLIFMKQFTKSFLQRYRKQRGLNKEVNEDYIEQFNDLPEQKLVITEPYLKLFHQIWTPLIPELLYIEDGQLLAPKILTDLAMFEPNKYLSLILKEIKIYLQKDLTICSTYTGKMTILFLQQFIIQNYFEQDQFVLLIECSQLLLDAVQNLGISQNLDILQLVMRAYMYFPENSMQKKPILKGLTDDIIIMIQKNLDSMSISLENMEGQQAELYTDFKNIYFNFILRLNDEQIRNMCDKLLFKIKTMVPTHRQAYEFIIVALTFKSPEFTKKIADFLYKQIVSSNCEHRAKSNYGKIIDEIFPQSYQTKYLATQNQQNMKWYASVLQCAFQYNPENIVTYWGKLETILVLMLRQFDNPSIYESGLDILFNIIINLEHIHLDPLQFYKDSNRSYATMKNIRWKHPTKQYIEILVRIKVVFYDSITKYFRVKYQETLLNSDKATKIRKQQTIKLLIDNSEYQIPDKQIQVKQSSSQILDSLFAPSTPSPQDVEEKKIIQKLLSIQYSVFSALQMRTQFTKSSEISQLQEFFIKPLGNLRLQAITHLKWIIELLAHYNCLFDQTILKVFHYFWREAHDELFFSIGIQSTNDKLQPYFYPILYKKKQLFSNSFLIITECYLTFMMRVQLFNLIKPMAYLNDPEYFQYLSVFSYSTIIDSSLKSYVPPQVDIHKEYHNKILNLCRLKLSLSYNESYIRKLIFHSKNTNESVSSIDKEKFSGAIRVIVNNYRRNLSIFFNPCCMKDENCWYGILETIQITQYLEKKVEKIGMIQMIYLMVIFTFDFKGLVILESKHSDKQMADEQDTVIQQKIIGFLQFLIKKIHSSINKKFYDKHTNVHLLLLISFAEFVPTSHPMFQQFLSLIDEVFSLNRQDLTNLGKTFLFRIYNRFAKEKSSIISIQNCPIERPYQEFIIYRHLGGRVKNDSNIPPQNLITGKTENYYYPSKYLQYLYRQPLDPDTPNERALFQTLTDQNKMRALFKSLILDHELKINEQEVDLSYLNEEEPKKISSHGYKMLNYILDGNPKKKDIFLSFIDNYTNYPTCFYHRLFRKMMILGGSQTVQILKRITQDFLTSKQVEEVKLAQFIACQLLPFSFEDSEYFQFYSNFLINCSKDQFQFANGCLLITFCIDWKISKTIFNKIIKRLREQKGSSRMRHFEVFNNFLLCTGRFAQQEAIDGIQILLKGIQQGADEISEIIISMLIYCFIIPINLKILPEWVNQRNLVGILQKKIYRLNANTGYEINQSVKRILRQIVHKTTQEKELYSKNLMIYSKIAYRILRTITVRRFNDQFYKIFKDIMLYNVNKPQDQDNYDQQIILQLKNSEYPQHIYDDLLKNINSMQGNTIHVIKKKLKYIEGIVINKIYCTDQINIPDVFSTTNEKNITIDYIIAASNMARILKGDQLSSQVSKILSSEKKTIKDLNFMMAYLLAAGTRDFQWREKLLHEILTFKKHKIVKQFISYWWKGRSPETENEQRLYMLVRSVQNPYTYFA